MNRKEKYIEDIINVEFIEKQFLASFTISFVNLITIVALATDLPKNFISIFTTLLCSLPALVKYIIIKKYKLGEISFTDCYHKSVQLSIYGPIAWALNTLFIIWCRPYYDIVTFTLFIILLATLVSSPVTLTTHQKLFKIFTISYSSIFFIYSLERFIYTKENIYLVLLSLMIINYLYITKQRKVLFAEIFKRIQSEFEIKESLEALERETLKTFHAARLSSIGEMSESMAHEINNPLMIIQAAAKQMTRLDSSNISLDTVHHKSDKILHASERISRIILSLKAISHIEDKTKIQEINIFELIENIKLLYVEKFTSHNIAFHILGDDKLSLNISPGHITQVLINLINNAFDALVKYDREDSFIKIVFEKNLDQKIIIRVLNSGPTIPPEIALKLFSPFYTTKQDSHKLGLALSMSKAFIEQMGGDLSYEEHQGLTAFKLVLNISKS